MPKYAPVTEPPGQLYCFKCAQLLPVGAFYHVQGKPTRPCKACKLIAKQFNARFAAEWEARQEELRNRPPPPPPVVREFAPMDGFAKWLAQQERTKGRRPVALGTAPVFLQKSEAG